MNVWLTVYRLACVAFAAILIVVIIALFLPKVRQVQDRTRRTAIIEEENRVKEEMTKQLRQQQERFTSDPKCVERVAREELGKAKPGETIFRFSEKKTNDYRGRR
jgi:cell division protein FtsB